MRKTIRLSMDPEGDSKGNTVDDIDALVLFRGGFESTTVTTWAPVSRYDIAWNFEKFLFDKDGCLVKRYSPFYPLRRSKLILMPFSKCSVHVLCFAAVV